MHPVAEKSITKRNKSKWLSEESLELKKKGRKQERRYRCSGEMIDKEVFRNLMKIYRNYLSYQHSKYLQEQIEDDKLNSKKLYSLVNDMIGQNKDLPLPDSKLDSELASSTYFLLIKITKIRDDLGKQENFILNSQFNDNIKLEAFRELMQLEGEKIVKSLKSTTCGSDPMPCKLIKWHLDVLLLMITRTVNYSLTAGVFNESWKTSIIKPLLKREGIDRVLKNYRPVNNLSFTSKIVQKSNAAKDQ